MDNRNNGGKLFHAFDTAQINHQCSRLREGEALWDVLYESACKHGLSGSGAEALVNQILTETSNYLSIREEVEGSLSDAANRLFHLLENIHPHTRIMILDHLLLGLECVCDDEAVVYVRTKRDNLDGFYYEVRGEGPIWSPETEKQLRRKILELLHNMKLSPKLLQHMITRFGSDDSWTATAAAFGQSSYELKCLAAMNLVMRGGEYADVSQAVLSACMDIDERAAAYAVARGQASEDTAFSILSTKVCAGLLILCIFTLTVSSPSLF